MVPDTWSLFSPVTTKGAVMLRHQLVPIGTCVLLGCVVLGVFLSQRSVAQPAAGPTGKIGKYQVSITMTVGPTRSLLTQAILCDTETGQMWQRSVVGAEGGEWSPLSSPVY